MRNKLNLTQRNFGLIGTIIFFVTAFTISIINWQDASLSISQHIGLNSTSIITFGFINTITTTLVAICLLSYIARRWELGKIFKVLAWILITGLYIIGWFPDQFDNTVNSIIHTTTAFAVFTVMVVIVATLGALLWDRTGLVLKITVAIFAVSGLLGVITSSFFLDFFLANKFWIESFYIIAFFAFMLSMVYSRDRSKGNFIKRYLSSFENWLKKVLQN